MRDVMRLKIPAAAMRLILMTRIQQRPDRQSRFHKYKNIATIRRILNLDKTLRGLPNPPDVIHMTIEPPPPHEDITLLIPLYRWLLPRFDLMPSDEYLPILPGRPSEPFLTQGEPVRLTPKDHDYRETSPAIKSKNGLCDHTTCVKRPRTCLTAHVKPCAV